MKQRYSLRDYKFSLVVLVLAISVIGIFMVRSARPEYMTRQILEWFLEWRSWSSFP